MKIFEKLKSVFRSLIGQDAGTQSKLLGNMAQNKVVLCALVGLALIILVILAS